MFIQSITLRHINNNSGMISSLEHSVNLKIATHFSGGLVQQPPKRNKEKDRKKKRSKNSPQRPAQQIIPEGLIALDITATPGTSTQDISANNAVGDCCSIGPLVLELKSPSAAGELPISSSPMITDTNEEAQQYSSPESKGATTGPVPAPTAQTSFSQDPIINPPPPVTDEYALVKHYADLQSEIPPLKSETLFPTKAARSEKNATQLEEGFCCVISMYDGVVVFTTPTITESLGFPRDMWLGRSFIDFVHPKDRHTFASQISSGVPFLESKGVGCMAKEAKNCLYVMLRKYRGLKNFRYGIAGNDVIYEPYKLVLNFREGPDVKEDDGTSPAEKKKQPYTNTMLLIITATPVAHFYKRECSSVKQAFPLPNDFIHYFLSSHLHRSR